VSAIATHEAAAGTYTRKMAMTIDQACDEVAERSARYPRRHPIQLRDGPETGPALRRGRKLQALTRADGDPLVRWLLTEARTSPKHYRADSLAGRVVALVSEHPEGPPAAALPGGDVHSALSALLVPGGSPACGGVSTNPPSPRPPPPPRNEASARRPSGQP